MKPVWTDTGLVKVDLWRGAFLLLTPTEYHNGIKRGKAARMREANAKRTQAREQGNILEAIEPTPARTRK